MSNYKEIVTKAIIGKGKKLFTTTNETVVDKHPSTILGCWVINHNFDGKRNGDSIIIDGSYDVNVWYSYDNDTKTDVLKEKKNYQEKVNIRPREDTDNEEIIVRSLKQPSCVKVDINGDAISYTIEKELGIELVGDTKVKIEINEEEDPWEEIVEGPDTIEKEIDENVQEEFLDKDIIQEDKIN